MGLEPMISPFSLSLRGEEVPLVRWLKIFAVQNPFTLGNMLLRTSCTLGRKGGGGGGGVAKERKKAHMFMYRNNV